MTRTCLMCGVDVPDEDDLCAECEQEHLDALADEEDRPL